MPCLLKIGLALLCLIPSLLFGASIKLVPSGTTQSIGDGTVTVNVTSVDMSKPFLVFQTSDTTDVTLGSTLGSSSQAFAILFCVPRVLIERLFSFFEDFQRPEQPL